MKCPKCNNGIMIEIRSYYVKKCSSCAHEVSWPLNKGQKPLLGSNRAK